MKKPRPIEGQTSVFDERPSFGCECICRDCLMWWSSRCPYGECYDDHRAEVNPYDKAHPNKPPRTAWTSWKDEQAFWCRGGTSYPTIYCEHYVKYKGSVVKSCLRANVQIFQDGFMRCGIGEYVDCETCYKQFEEELEEQERTNYGNENRNASESL